MLAIQQCEDPSAAFQHRQALTQVHGVRMEEQQMSEVRRVSTEVEDMTARVTEEKEPRERSVSDSHNEMEKRERGCGDQHHHEFSIRVVDITVPYDRASEH